MTKQITTSIEIKATKQTVWKVLIDFEQYPKWNPFIKSIEGTLQKGNSLYVKLLGMKFKPTIIRLEQNSELTWLGKLWFKGLFDGEHKFYLRDNDDGTVTFEHSEIFSGLLVRLFSKSLDNDTKSGFIEMNRALKDRVENL